MACTSTSAPVKALPRERGSPAKAWNGSTRPPQGSRRPGSRVVTAMESPDVSRRRFTTSRPMKPVPPVTTIRIGSSYTPSSGATSSLLSLPPTVMRRALVVEDDPDIVELLEHYLKGEGFQVDALDDGRRALERIRAGTYQLLVLDLQLPGLDGLALRA